MDPHTESAVGAMLVAAAHTAAAVGGTAVVVVNDVADLPIQAASAGAAAASLPDAKKRKRDQEEDTQTRMRRQFVKDLKARAKDQDYDDEIAENSRDILGVLDPQMWNPKFWGDPTQLKDKAYGEEHEDKRLWGEALRSAISQCEALASTLNGVHHKAFGKSGKLLNAPR